MCVHTNVILTLFLVALGLLTIVALAFKLSCGRRSNLGGALSVQVSSHAWRSRRPRLRGGARGLVERLPADRGPMSPPTTIPAPRTAVDRLDLSPRSQAARAARRRRGRSASAPPAATAVYGDPVELTARVGGRSRSVRRLYAQFRKHARSRPLRSPCSATFSTSATSIDPRAQGTISLSSGRPIPKKDLLFVLENALKANGLALVRDPAGYRILSRPATTSSARSIAPRAATASSRATASPSFPCNTFPRRRSPS